ncbi:MAG: mechanosensitive ion channel family protein [Hyphomicrobiales bacterium]
MKPSTKRSIWIVLCLLLVFCFVGGPAWAQKFPMPKAKKPSAKTEEAASPALPQTPEQVDAYMGSLTDEQARQTLTQVLKREIAAKAKAGEDQGGIRGRDGGIGALFYRLANNASALLQKLSGFFTAADGESDDLGEAWRRLTGGKGIGRLMLEFFALSGILVAGFLLRKLFYQSTRDIHERLLTSVKLGRLDFLGRVLSRLMLEALGIGVFAAATFVLFVIFFQKGDPGYELVSIYLIVSYYLLLFAFAARIIFAPYTPTLRLFPMKDEEAAFFYRWILYIAGGAGVIAGASAVFGELGAGRQLYLLFYSLGGAYVTAVLIVLIWKCRNRMAEIILPKGVEAVPGSTRRVLSRYWHYLASLYVIGMGVYWVADVLLGGDAKIVNLILSLFVIPILVGLDQWGQRLLKMASGELTAVVDLSGEQVADVPPPTSMSGFRSYVPMIRRLFRVALVACTFFIVLDLWGVDVALGGWIFTTHVLSIAVTLLLGFIVWEFVKARIDSRIRQEMPSSDEDHEEGGAVGSRTGTLLVLLRKFILAVLFVTVSLIVLSSIGVNIGPLIAGAGVVGLAIGFGAQTLVRDIIAGIFFLIDDSFRVGDYVESTGVKGMVEQISLRSIKLRHPRGMVYTVPFGNLKSITNFSRDYTITKLDIRVHFDTDLEQVRKVIKKINKALRKDEDINKIMLDDLKSQGVKEFDDSSMIVRVKFKTLPGEQFKVRKEVYRMLQEEFRASGIEFASRNVTVYMPPEVRTRASDESGKQPAGESNDQAIRQAGAAAALALIQKEEEEKAKAAAAAKSKEK